MLDNTNMHECNYECGFYFHNAKTSYIAPITDAKRGLELLAKAGIRKINFADEEPFLHVSFIGKLLKLASSYAGVTKGELMWENIFRYCKEELHLKSVSIVTNGSLVKPGFLKEYGKYIDILTVSCNSFDETTNTKIGREKGTHLKSFIKLSKQCLQYNIKFKVNTVVNRYNFTEDINKGISLVNPYCWKCF